LNKFEAVKLKKIKSKKFVLLGLVLLISWTNQNIKPITITDDEKASIKLEIEKLFQFRVSFDF